MASPSDPSLAPTASTGQLATAFVCYAWEHRAFVDALSEGLTEHGVRARGDWEFVDGEDFHQQADRLILESDVVILAVAPSVIDSTECARELRVALELGKRILPVLREDCADAEYARLPDAVRTIDFTHLREADDWQINLKSLADALRTDIAQAQLHRRLAVRTDDWLAGVGTLASGAELKVFEGFLDHATQHPKRLPQPTGGHRKYVLASRAAERRRSQRLRWATTALVGVAIIGVAVWLRNRWDAETQRSLADSRRLAAAALSNRERRLDLSLLLSIEAFQARNTSEARNALMYNFQFNPRLFTYFHHPATVWGVAFSPNAKLLASAGDDHLVRLWDVTTGRLLYEPLRGHSDTVVSVAFSPNGAILASGGSDRTIRLWNIARGTSIGEPLRGHTNSVLSVAFSPDGSTLVSAGADGSLRFWDVPGRQQITVLQLRNSPSVWSAAFSPDGSLVASASADKTVQLWDVRAHTLLRELGAHNSAVSSICFSSDGKGLASASADGTIRLWDVGERALRGHPIQAHPVPALSLACSPVGGLFASAGADGLVKLWDFAAPGAVRETLQRHTDSVWGLDFSAGGTLLASASSDKTARLWSISPGMSQGRVIRAHHGPVQSIAIGPDHRTLISGGADKVVRQWDAETGKPVGTALSGHAEAVLAVTVTADGHLAASGDASGTVRLWDLRTQRSLDARRWLTDSVHGLAFSPDSRRLLSASADHKVRFWNLGNRQEPPATFSAHTDEVWSIAFRPDGKVFATAGADRTVRLWDANTGRALAELTDGRDPFWAVAFSPNGRTLAAGGYDKLVRLWDVESRRLTGDPLQGHTGFVRALAFSPDGGSLASAGEDQTVRLWDLASRQIWGEPLKGHAGAVWSITFSHDGKWLISGGDDGTIRIWDVDPETWISRACARANRNLSGAEWEQYLGRDIPYRRTCPALPPGEGVNPRTF